MYRWNPFTNNLDEKGDWFFGGNTLGDKKLLGSIDNQDFGIITNNTERLTVLKDGNVGIGTTAPDSLLSVDGGSYQLLKLKRTDTFDFVQYRRASGTWTDITVEAGTSLGTVSGDVLDAIGDTFVIGKSNMFGSIYIDLGTARSATGVFIWEYSLGGDTWAELTCTDETNFLLNDGVISFSAPTDWATDSQNGSAQLYFVRLRVVSSTFTTEPTVYLVVPNAGDPVFEVYGNGMDTIPGLAINRNGQVTMGFSNTSTSTSTYRLSVNGSVLMAGALSGVTTLATRGASTNTLSATGFNHIGGFILNGPAASAIIPNQNSPILRFSSQSWNGTLTRINAMDIYVNPDSEPVTNARMAFKNTTVDGIADASELMNLDTNGRLSVVGRAQASEDMFDRVFSFIGGVWTDLTLAVSSFGTITGDVLNVVNDFVYIGKEDQFNEMYFDFGTIMSAGTNRSWEYWNGTTWENLTVTDGTNNWANNGSTTFTPPVDWATSTVNNVTDLYWVRVGTVSGTFITEPRLKALLPNTVAITKEVLSNNWFNGTTGWTSTGDLLYTTNDYTFTYSTGLGTLRQAKENFNSPLEPNTWYRFRYTLGVAGPANTIAWIGQEVATGKTYFQATSTTEVDAFFKTNSNPGDFVIYVQGTASGLRLDNVFLKKLENGRIYASGDIRSDGVFRGNGTDGIKVDSLGNVGIGITTPTAKLDINSDILRLRTAKTPATAGASGNQGDIAWDNGYLYVCVATNTWKRAELLTW